MKVRYVLLGFWAVVLVAVLTAGWWSGQGPVAWLRLGLESVQQSPFAWFWLLLVYLVRPLVLLPMTLLTLATGLFFGVGWGFLYANIAIILSTTLAYYLGRYMSATLPALSPRWQQWLQAHTFESVFIARLIALPGDVVNYAAGMLRIDIRAFLLATLLGGSPGLLVGILAGAALEEGLQQGKLRLEPHYLVLAGVLALLMSGLAWWLRRRLPQANTYENTQANTHEDEAPPTV